MIRAFWDGCATCAASAAWRWAAWAAAQDEGPTWFVDGRPSEAAYQALGFLLAAEAGAPLKDEDRVEYAAVEEMSRCVIAYGPLCGLGAYNIGNDYYNADMNYKMIRQAIQTLNPSK